MTFKDLLAAQAALEEAEQRLADTRAAQAAAEGVYRQHRRREPAAQSTDETRDAWQIALVDWVGARVEREKLADELRALQQQELQP